MVLAWHMAALQRTDKMPELKTLLARQQTGGRQTPAQQRTMMDMMSARYGVPLKRIRLLRKEIH